MNYFFFSMVSVGLLASLLGCSQASSPLPEKEPSTAPTIVYRCPDGYRFSATFPTDHSAQLTLANKQRVTLPSAPAASGTQYAAGQTIFRRHENEAMLTLANATHEHCMADPVKEGVRFEARGQEPGWYLEIRDEQVEFVGDYGETRALIPITNLSPTEKNGQVIYDVPMETGHFKIISREGPCLDAMSGHPYERTVAVILNEKTYQGCGE